MTKVDRIVEKALLFDFYGELLTEHQKMVYGEYIHNDLSVSEMAGILGISRQGAHDLIRRCEKSLYEYENRLHLVEHFREIRKMVGQIRRCADEIISCDDRELEQTRAREIANLSGQILDAY